MQNKDLILIALKKSMKRKIVSLKLFILEMENEQINRKWRKKGEHAKKKHAYKFIKDYSI